MSTGKSAASWTMKKIVRPQSLALRMADQIRELIVNGEIELGTLISENDIASKLQVSRTPVREALQKLETERLVQIIPQRGTYVFQFNEQEMQQTCKMSASWKARRMRIGSCDGLVTSFAHFTAGAAMLTKSP